MCLTFFPHKQMCNMVTAMLLSLPNGAEWNLRHTYGTKDTQRPQMWVAVVSAMMQFAGLGRDRPLSAMITMWKYSMTDPDRGFAYRRFWNVRGKPLHEVAAVARPMLGTKRKKDLTKEQEDEIAHNAWNQKVSRESIIVDYFANAFQCMWAKMGKELHRILCQPCDEYSAPILHLNVGETAWDTPLSQIEPVDGSPPKLHADQIENFRLMLWFDPGVYYL